MAESPGAEKSLKKYMGMRQVSACVLVRKSEAFPTSSLCTSPISLARNINLKDGSDILRDVKERSSLAW